MFKSRPSDQKCGDTESKNVGKHWKKPGQVIIHPGTWFLSARQIQALENTAANGDFVIKLNPCALWVHLERVRVLRVIDYSDLINLIDLISEIEVILSEITAND